MYIYVVVFLQIVLYVTFGVWCISNSSPRCKRPITLDEFEWKNNEFVRNIYKFDPTFLTHLATQTNFSDNGRIWMLNFTIWLTKKRRWMKIWRNWTLDLNAVSFSGRNWIENWWNWMMRWRKWAGKYTRSTAHYNITHKTCIILIT